MTATGRWQRMATSSVTNLLAVMPIHRISGLTVPGSPPDT
jgi:hypothetical protein